MGNNNSKVRLAGLDIVRTIAVLFVICVHFFLNSGYYSQKLEGGLMFAMTYARWLFLICVPLFMILTGFFKYKKTLCKAHYMSLVPILCAYVVLSFAKILVSHRVYGISYAEMNIARQLFNYSFAWYVGMYISMILLIPFFNVLWNNLPSIKEKRILLVSLAFVCSMYPIVLYVAPSYWQMLYPLFYYYLGAYISEYRPHPNKILLVFLALAATLVNALISFLSVNGSNFNWTIIGTVDCGYNAITVVITAVSIFLLFYDVDVKSKILKTIYAKISEVSFEMYLTAAIYDIFIYAFLSSRVYNYSDYAWIFFIVVPLNFVLSWITSMVYKYIYNICSSFITEKCRKKAEK